MLQKRGANIRSWVWCRGKRFANQGLQPKQENLDKVSSVYINERAIKMKWYIRPKFPLLHSGGMGRRMN